VTDRLPLLLILATFSLGGCVAPGEELDVEAAGCRSDADCSDTPETPVCRIDTGTCQAGARGALIGDGDGSPSSVTLVAVYTAANEDHDTVDLAFHPERSNELWVLLRGPCAPENVLLEGCDFESRIAVVWGPGHPESNNQIFTDPNAWHFMRRAPAMAFGANGTFATIGEAPTGNLIDDPVMYIGPTLWSSRLPVLESDCDTHPDGCFSVQPPGLNGSHLDMLHESPWAMGIAHERDNVYWVFNGHAGSIDRYDFKVHHGPGNENHDDGELTRYVVGQLTRTPNVPGHMVFDHASGQLFVADTGGGRIVKLDPASGSVAGEATPQYEELASNQQIDGATLVDVVPAGTLVSPSGLELDEGILYVTDAATGRIHAFDSTTGAEVRSLDTGLEAGALAGFAVGPDRKAYFVDNPAGVVYRIDAQ
jgi:hypothetical protein